MKKFKFLMLFCLFGSMAFAAPKTTKAVKNEYDLILINMFQKKLKSMGKK